MNRITLGVLLLAVVVGTARADTVRDTSYVVDGSRVLRHELDVNASPTEVFAAFTTEDGWRSWATPFVRMTPATLSRDRHIEAAYKLDGRIGDPTNIHQQILAFVPNRMLAFRVAHAPKGFPFPTEVVRVFSVMELAEVAPGRTHVTLSMIGYGSGPGFDGLYKFFAEDNPWALGQLQTRFEKGPADWKKLLAKPAN